MAHGAYPPSSPTPHPHPSKPSPLASTTASPAGRRRLTRASSTDSQAGLSGYVTASGLSTWRRSSKSAQGSESGKRGGYTGKKGLGMGMEGTPARRKRARRPTSRSIGMQSTPRASVVLATRKNGSSSSTSVPLSSLPDPDETTLSSDLAPRELDSPGLPSIARRNPRAAEGEADVFGLMTFIAPDRSNPHASSSFPLTEPHLDTGSVTLFPRMEEFSVPVNFFSTEFYSPEPEQHTEGNTTQEARRAMLRDEASYFDFTVPLPLAASDDISTSQNPVSSRLSDNSSRDDGPDGDLTVTHARAKSHLAAQEISVTHEDLSVPLDDHTNPSTSRRLTRTISKISAGAASRFTDSRVGSRTRERLATPYRPRNASAEHVSPEEEQTDGEISPQEASQGTLPHGNSRIERAKRDEVNIEGVPAAEAHSDEYNDVRVSLADADTKPDLMLRSHHGIDSPGKAASCGSTRSGRLFRWGDLGCSEGVSDLDVSECEMSLEAARPLHDIQQSDIFDNRWHQEEPVSSEGMYAAQAGLYSDFPLADEPAILPTVPSSPLRQWMFPPLVKGLLPPVPFIPSSQLGTPLPSPHPSEFTSPSACASRSRSSPTSPTGNGGPHVTAFDKRSTRRMPLGGHQDLHEPPKAKWLGARVLRRMEGMEDGEDEEWD